MTCVHPDSNNIIDCHSGDIICTACGQVLEKDFVREIPMPHADLNGVEQSVDSLYDICANNHIAREVFDKALEIKKHIRLILPKRSVSHVNLFSLYFASKLVGVPYLIKEVAAMHDIKPKEASRIISAISKSSGYLYCERELPTASNYFHRLSYPFLRKNERHRAFRLCKKLPTHFQLKNPELFVSAIIYNYKKSSLSSKEKTFLLKSIATQLCVNRRSIKLLDKSIDFQNTALKSGVM